MVCEANLIESLLKSRDFSSASAYPPSFPVLLGDSSLLLLDGDEHKRKRATVAPAFTPTVFSSYFPTLLRNTYRFWQMVEQTATESSPITMMSVMKDYYLRNIIDITSGMDLSEDDFEELKEQFYTLTAGITALPFSGGLNRAKKARVSIRSFFGKAIRRILIDNADEIDQLRSANDDLSPSVARVLKSSNVDILAVAVAQTDLKTGSNEVHDETILDDLANMVVLLWIAGYSTQAAVAVCCIVEMQRNPDMYERLLEEQENIMEDSESPELSYEQVKKQMPLLDSYVREITRYHPPVQVAFRKASRDTTIGGHFVKKGDKVGVDFKAAQRDDKFFRNADNLIIDRFIGENADNPKRVLSWSTGPHICLGQALSMLSIKTTLAVLLRNYGLELKKGQNLSMKALPERGPRSGLQVVKCTRRALHQEGSF